MSHAYATFEEVKHYLRQLPPNDDEIEVIIDGMLINATGVVDEVLGFSFLGHSEEEREITPAIHGNNLLLPPFDPDSITLVTITNENGETEELTSGQWWLQNLYKSSLFWLQSREQNWDWMLKTPILITAQWGYGEPPSAVKEVVRQLITSWWGSKGAGHFRDVIHAKGAVGYGKAMTSLHHQTLKQIASRFESPLFYAGLL